MNIPTPLVAAALFVVTLICVVALMIADVEVPRTISALITLFAGAALGGAVPNITLGDPKP